MEALISGIPNLKLKEQIREDDFVDQLHHFVTVYLLAAFAVIMALKEFASSPLDCWFSNQTWKHFQDHANFYCWTHKLYRYPNPDNLAEVPYELSPVHGGPKNQTIVDTEDLGEINFYRWITVIFLCQAFMFKLPNLLWNECNEYSGTQIEKMVTMIGGTSFDSKEKKDVTFSGVAEYVEIWLKVNRKPFSFMRTRVGRQTKKILSHCMLCVGANTGNYLSTMYLVVKFLFLINILGQFLILTAFLRFDYWQYGAKAMMIYEDYEERMDNIHFPRVALCHFQVKGQGSWIQCLLTINMLLEKMFVMEWFWLFLLLLLTIYSLFAWIVRILRTDYSVQFVTKYLSIFNEDGSLPHEGKRTVLTFVRDYLGNDGIFMLRILAVNTNDVVMAELICHMWKRYTEYHYKEPVKESEVDTDPLNEDESEKKDDSAGTANGTKDRKTVDGTTGNEKPNQVAPDVYHIA